HTVAVDKRIIPMGSKLLINGVVYTAEDIGGAVKGKHIDIFFDTHDQTRQFGSRTAEVYLLQ
ncbi:MAG: 3D domain-containing protein, partial [Clostridium sp.]